MSKTINPNDYQKLEKELADALAKVARLEAKIEEQTRELMALQPVSQMAEVKAAVEAKRGGKAAPIEAPTTEDDGA